MPFFPYRSYQIETKLSKEHIYERLWNQPRSKYAITDLYFNKSAQHELSEQNMRDSLSLDNFTSQKKSPYQIFQGKLFSVEDSTAIEIKVTMGTGQKLFLTMWTIFWGGLSMLAVLSISLYPKWTSKEFFAPLLFLPPILLFIGHLYVRHNFKRFSDFTIKYYRKLFEATNNC